MVRMETVTGQPCVIDGLVSAVRKCEVKKRKRKNALGRGESVVEVVDA